MHHQLPMTALVGLNFAQQALLLLAVEPRLRGVIFSAPAGTGKTTLARGFASLLDPHAHQRFVELPASADEEALLGGTDIEATLRTERRVVRAGLLARAHNGVLHADHLNLLSDASANTLLGALDNGEVRIEREGLSVRAPAHFTFIGSYDSAEGAPRQHLLDRVGLLVSLPAHCDENLRAEVVQRNLSHAQATASYNDELDILPGLIAAARNQLPLVTLSDQQTEQLAAAAMAFGVEGHRADLFAVYAACASAALDLRDQVEQADLELAVRLVILPRATCAPASDNQPSENQGPRTEDQEPGAENQEPEAESREPEEGKASTSDVQPSDEQVFAALAAELPADLSRLPFRALRRGCSGSRGTTAGARGRHIRSTLGDPRRARIDVAATLRAAAPWQLLRMTTDSCPLITSLPGSQGHDVVGRQSPVVLHSQDIRIKQFRSKAGALFCFAVDASGSMALHRMRQAKGAVHALLQRAYVHRDRVALLSFRGERADLLLPPSQSVELARRALDLLPTGGGTPLAAALLAALAIAKQARSHGIMQTVLVLLTDGRANVGLRAGRDGIEAELRVLGRSIVEAGIHTMVIDTQRSYLSRGEARHLAEWLGGQYIYLPNARGEQIAELVGEQIIR